MRETSEGRAKEKGRRLELSVAQVAGSAVAAVGAAVLASKMGVYGTILGAGVVSVVATAGGTLFQHLFRRTGEQLKEATAPTRPRERVAGGEEPGPDRPAPVGVYTEPTTHGTRLRGWKRPFIATGVVFLVAMGAITGIEMASGGPVSNVWGGDSRGTTVANSVHSSGSGSAPTLSGTPSDGGATPSDGGSPSATDPATPSDGGTRKPSDSPSPTDSTGEDKHGGGTGDTGGGTGGSATPSPTPPAPTPGGTGDTDPQPSRQGQQSGAPGR